MNSEQPVFTDAGLERLCGKVQADVDAGRIPGAVFLVADRRRTVVERAIGRQAPGEARPMGLDSIFRIYSMTKPLVSVGIMMLVEEGRLLIGDPVAKYLPELAGLRVGMEEAGDDGPGLRLEPVRQEITVQDLLRHTSGITYGFFGDSLVKRAYVAAGVESRHLDNDELLRRLGDLPLAYQPGTVWEYGRSTDVLGALLERLSGEDLEAFLRRRILAPLGMDDTAFSVPAPELHRIAEAFATDPVNGVPVSLIDVRQRPSFLSGGGGLVSTVHDYLRFARLLLAGGSLDGVRLLAPRTLAFMASDHLGGLPLARSGASYLPGPGYGFGLGFSVRLAAGEALTPGNVGDFNWSGLGGTYFWVDPVAGFTALWMMQAPEQRAHYRQLFRNLVYGALD